jgi:serine/threonine protein kinase
LKPENAVVDSKGYLHMIDLGTAKKLTDEKGNRTFTIIGKKYHIQELLIIWLHK